MNETKLIKLESAKIVTQISRSAKLKRLVRSEKVEAGIEYALIASALKFGGMKTKVARCG